MPGEGFPKGDSEFRTWLANLVANEGVTVPLGLPIGFWTALNNANTAYGPGLDAHFDAAAEAESKKAAKDVLKATAIRELRIAMGALRANPGFTDAMATALGMQILDDILTHIEAPTTAPELELVAFGPQEVRCHFWDPGNPSPGRRGKGPGARSCRLIHAILAVGSGAPSVDDMEFLADSTNTPNNETFEDADIGKTLWIRGAWVSPTGELGPTPSPAASRFRDRESDERTRK